ncbi:MAG: UbiD family decarboxylase [Betaproteobacteria bacterium]|nr:UbiD family decarboxylase [Betaproteobacteria bacterium]
MGKSESLSISHAPPAGAARPLDRDLRGYLATNSDVVTRITKPVSIENIPALSAQSEQPILFENIAEKPGFRLCDILVKHRHLQARALGVSKAEYLRTLAYRLRLPPRGFKYVKDGPVKEVKQLGKDADWTRLPVPIHTDLEEQPYVTAMNLVKDPETGFYNASHAGTIVSGPRSGLPSFVTPHTHVIMNKYREIGQDKMPYAFVFGIPPAYEIMANYSGQHMDMWGELEMVGTIMDQDVEMVACETIDMSVPAHAEIVVEGWVHFGKMFDVGVSVSPSSYFLPKSSRLPGFELTAITMRGDRPIYRNHQTCPETDHQPLPRLCHEAMVYNRLTEMGLKVTDVRFPTWGAALSCIIQFEYPRQGFVNDALMLILGSPWLNTKMVVAISPDTNIEKASDVYHAIATRCDPSRDIFVVSNTRGSPYDPSAALLPGDAFWRTVGKIGIDATAKARHDAKDFIRSWPRNWGKVRLEDYL